MNPKQLEKETGLPARAVKLLEKKGLISSPITEEELIGMAYMAKSWGDRDLIRCQISKERIEDRAKMVLTAGHTKLEIAVITRYLNHYNNNDQEKGYLSTDMIADELITNHRLKKVNRKELKEMIKKMRKKVNNMRARHLSLVEMTQRLTKKKKAKKTRQVANNGNYNTSSQIAAFDNIFGKA